jgi:hypothetical protein
MKRILFLTPLLLLLSSCVPERDTIAFFLAKETCSCRFLVGLTAARCRDAVRPALLLGSVKVNETERTATGTSEGGRYATTFRFVSEREGCALMED